MQTINQHQFLTVQQGAERLNVSVWTLRSWAYAGRIASHKFGSRLMISRQELDRIIRESERPRLSNRPKESA
ncbi:helix-turn-helix domain-containing protein [Acidipila rosea]|uniref:Excisionase family DNA binding protein n=1 Tax=Acidipila rosea TaxID=768535 RepID=A0A4R1LBM3_9BACT|nr:excisionase family DNA binding protein [Acidipila rosea]